MTRKTFQLGSRTVELRDASATEIIALRHAALREGMPRSAAQFDGDHGPSTQHYGAFDAGPFGSHTLCCVSYMPTDFEGQPAWQLRGMATRADVRGGGIGRRLLTFAEASLREVGPLRQMWCNARSHAVGFYEKQGWAIASDAFHIETVGPHFQMTKRLAD